jgi:hypothetical protein
MGIVTSQHCNMTPSIVGQQSPVKLTTAHAVLELHVAETMAKSLGALVGVVKFVVVALLLSLVVIAVSLLLSFIMSRSAGVGGMTRTNGAIVGILVIFIIIIIGSAVLLFVVLVGSNNGANVSLLLPVAGVVPGAKVNGGAIVVGVVGRTTVGDDVLFPGIIMNGVGAAVKFVIPVSLVAIPVVVLVFVVIGGSSGVVPFVVLAMTGGNVLGVDGSATPPPLPPTTTGALVG